MARILVADNDEGMCDLLRYVLALDGHDVTTAGDGEEALRLFRLDEYDLLCLGLDMPRLSGTELTRAVRAQPSDGVPSPPMACPFSSSPSPSRPKRSM